MQPFSENRFNIQDVRNRLAAWTALGTVSLFGMAACGGEPTPEPGPTTPSVQPSNPEKHTANRYPEHRVVATVFYIGEGASADNAGIDNISTEWESDARKTFGGVDDPNRRTADGLPKHPPKENPFYFALPASEFDDNGPIKGAREASPWAKEAKALPDDDSLSLFKGRWIAVHRAGSDKMVYGQWLDTGPGDDPSAVRDYKYVFGDSKQKPKNKFGLKAGLDLSPAMAHQLGFGIDEGSSDVVWQFVEEKDVPNGLWRKYKAIDKRTHWD
jgi:hypothetical protein